MQGGNENKSHAEPIAANGDVSIAISTKLLYAPPVPAAISRSRILPPTGSPPPPPPGHIISRTFSFAFCHLARLASLIRAPLWPATPFLRPSDVKLGRVPSSRRDRRGHCRSGVSPDLPPKKQE